MEESGELVFLRYAFPAIGVCSSENPEEMEVEMFEQMLKYGGSPDRKRLEELFPQPVKSLKSWNPKDVRDYWLKKHNELVGKNRSCKVYGFEVSEVYAPEKTEVCLIKVTGVKSLAARSYIELRKGDLISMHGLEYVAEKLTEQDFNAYFGAA